MFNSLKEVFTNSNKSDLESTIAEIEQQKQLYESIISSTPDLVCVIDPDFRFVFANKALLELMGVSKEDLLGKSLKEVSSNPAGLDRYEKELEQVIKTKKKVRGEDAFSHNKLGLRSYHYIFMPIFDSQGEVKAVAAATRDITERKKAEWAMRENEEKYRTLVENFPRGAVGLFDENLRYTAAGGELMDDMGVAPEDRIGSKVSDLYPEELVEEVEPYFRSALEGKASSFEAELHGRYFYAHTLPINNEEGDVFVGMLVVQDITERWQAQRDLSKSEEKYRTLFETMDEGFCIIQMEFNKNEEPVDFHFLETNPAFQKHAGINIREGDRAKEVLPHFDEDMLQRNGQVALKGEPSHKELYVEELNRWLDLSAFRIGEPEERKVAILLQNVTERKQIQEELKSINESLEQRVEERTQSLLSYQSQLRSLASKLSKAEENERHELATELHDNLGQMLAVNKMKMDLLRKDHLPDDTVTSLEEIKQGMEDAIVYTRNLMSDLKPPPSLDKEDIRATIKWLAEKMKKHQLTVHIEDDGQEKCTSEEIRTTILQSVREVLFNVIKHAGVDEALIHMHRMDNKAQIIVEDEGKGFDTETMTSASIEDGGFGLFNIKERMDLLGGSINIDSEPGEGTKVTLIAPLKDERSETVSDTPHEEEATGGTLTGQDTIHNEQIEVMLVDDHQMMRKGLKNIVNRENDLTVVAEASDGQEAVDSAKKHSPDVVLMDVDMPIMNGIDATQNILSVMPEVRVIGLSFHSHGDVIESMREVGASAFLSKEEAFETLCATIRSEASTVQE